MSILELQVKGASDAAALLRQLAPDEQLEGMLVVGLDDQQKMCGVAVNPRHRALAWVKVWELTDLTAELGACALVIGLFPGGSARPPSFHEINAFVDLCERARPAEVVLLDCIVMRGGQWSSLRQLSARFAQGVVGDA